MADSSSMLSMDRWGLAPGEEISQSPPIRALRCERTLFCPAPTLDTDEFIAQNAYNEDCSSVDSMADLGLAPGEVRSQSPFCSLHESQLPKGPPPTLDAQEFETKNESEDVWVVEDSLACWDLAPGECRSQDAALDVPNALNQFHHPSLDTQEFENNRVISDVVWLVEDSLACWDSGLGEARSEGARNHFNDFKSLGLRSSIKIPACTTDDKEQKATSLSNSIPVNCILEAGNSRVMGSNLVVPLSTSASKRSMPPTSPHLGSGKSNKQSKLDPGANFPDDPKSLLLPTPSTERSICGEGHRKVSTLRDTENSRKQRLEVTKVKNSGLGTLSSPKHTLPETVPRTSLDIQPMINNVDNVLYQTSSVARFAQADVKQSRVSAAISPRKSNCLPESHEVIFANTVEHLINPVRYPSTNVATTKGHELGHGMRGTEVAAKSLGQKTGRGGGHGLAQVQTSLHFESATSRKFRNQDNGRDSEGWLCPRDGKKFRPTSRQLSLDRFLT